MAFLKGRSRPAGAHGLAAAVASPAFYHLAAYARGVHVTSSDFTDCGVPTRVPVSALLPRPLPGHFKHQLLIEIDYEMLEVAKQRVGIVGIPW